jgi:acylphosphatase
MNQMAHVVFTGRVQGVGFRYTVRSIADNLAVVGWVKNLRSGDVEVVAEGPRPVLERFIGEIRQHFDSYIRYIDMDWEPASGEFTEFSIAF